MTTSPITSITDELLAELEANNTAARCLDAYYYSFDPTGCGLVDSVLSAVASAGKSFHMTEDWKETRLDGTTPEGDIQRAAEQSAAVILALLAERGELKRDARRYQHMRASASSQWRNGPGLYWYLPRYIQGNLGEQLDQAIDAAMQETKP